MPKIRGVKPEFWTDENVVELSMPARLLFIGLWNHACDNGHLQDKSKQIKMRILPTDDVNCAELLREIETQGLIDRADGWITIPNLPEHQKPHKHWYVICEKEGCAHPPGTTYGIGKTACTKPDCRHGSTVDQPLSNGGSPVGQPVTNGCSTADGDGDGDGDGRARATRRVQLPSTWKPTQQHAAFAATNRLNIEIESEQFKDHHRAKGSTMKDWDAAFRTWLRNAVKFAQAKERPEPPKYVPDTEIERPPVVATDEELAAWYAAQRAKKATA